LDEVQSTLQRLIEHEPSLAKMLPRQPGTKEARYVHLMSGDVAAYEPPTMAQESLDGDRMSRLEEEVGELRRKVSDLEQQLASFRRQFE
jgi:uncharacterized protein YceH (UPF0502 family)